MSDITGWYVLLYRHDNYLFTAGSKDITKFVISVTRQLVIITSLITNVRLLSNKFITIAVDSYRLVKTCYPFILSVV